MSIQANMLELTSPVKPGLVHAPTTHSASVELQKLLALDQRAHHVFVNDFGFYNHLSHHLVAAYDLGAPPALMRLIYENTEKILRPRNPHKLTLSSCKGPSEFEVWI
ncbi:hypothetical protein C8J57DRAFT_1569205 [Mycena rebaudengoi]|nr:hypothetical protein C8J57DRAFT_1569205 [Mycena rebaudengoi]